VSNASAKKQDMTRADSKAEPKITPELVAEHGLKPDEYQRALDLIGRAPMVNTSRRMPPTPVAAP
jgi:hypothetical protein